MIKLKMEFTSFPAQSISSDRFLLEKDYLPLNINFGSEREA